VSTLAEMKQYVADLARPSVLYAVGAATAFSIVRISLGDPAGWANGAVLIGAELGGLAVLYGAKALEETRKSGHSAEVEKERAKQSPAPIAALQPAPATPPAERSLEDPA
jgi:hypothetical protein